MIDVIALDALEIVFRLRIHQAEHGIRIRLAVHMGNAPGVRGGRSRLRA
jgi:hypothetical protein